MAESIFLPRTMYPEFFYLVSLLLLIVESKVHIKSMLNKDPSRKKVVCQNGNIFSEQKKIWQKKRYI
jgi:hypothetical protein